MGRQVIGWMDGWTDERRGRCIRMDQWMDEWVEE